MSYDKYDSPPTGSGSIMSLDKLAKYANMSKSDVSFFQAVDLMKFDPVTQSNVSLAEMIFNDRPIVGGVGKDAHTWGATHGHSLIMQSYGGGSGTPIFGKPAGSGDYADNGATISFTGIDGYSPNLYWHYNSIVTANTPKVFHQIINGFDNVTDDYEDITTGHSSSANLQQRIVSTEPSFTGRDAGFTDALQYVHEGGGSPEGFGNIGGGDIFSSDAGEIVVNFNIGNMGGYGTLYAIILAGWTVIRGDAATIGWDIDQPQGTGPINGWQITGAILEIGATGNYSYDFAGQPDQARRRIEKNGADIEDNMDPLRIFNVDRQENHQVFTFPIQITLHKASGCSPCP